MIHIHELGGSAPAPLAHYLKALGLLRLIAEQADQEARGWWEGERFRLATRLSRDELEGFLLERYEPTPMFNPWGGRSGFYKESSEKSAREVLNRIEQSADPRFDSYRAVVAEIRQVIAESFQGKKPGDTDKQHLILALHNSVRGKSTLWLDAVAALIGSGDQIEVRHPALFGTGGNEGSGSYTSAYMAAIDQCLIQRKWDHALEASVFGENSRPGCEWDQSMGQFLPSGAANPWDLLFAFEGGCIVRSAVSSRNTTANSTWMSSPFYVAPTSYGYPSEGRLDELVVNKGKELPGRGEQWLPLWTRPILLQELVRVFGEGRAATRRGRATDGWSMARAITSFGVRQGIGEFVRYGYQQRNNLATHFAIPLGRFRVPEQPSPALECLDDLDAWLPSLRREAHDTHAPARLAQAERRLADALFAVIQHPDEPARWQVALLALAEVEAIHRHGGKLRAGPIPIPRLRPGWVEAANDGSAAFRLALSCALQAGGFSRDRRPIDGVRRHWLPEKNGETAAVIQGRDGIADAIALVERRLIEAAQRGNRHLPLMAAQRAAAQPADLTAWIVGEVDPDRTLTLARSLMALDARACATGPALIPSAGTDRSPNGGRETPLPDDGWILLRLALLPWPLLARRQIGADPAILRRLASGDAAGAVEIARRRLSAAGIQVTVRAASVPRETARRWAAALAFPISKALATRFLRHLDPRSIQGDQP